MAHISMYSIVKEIVETNEKYTYVNATSADLSKETSKYSKYFKGILNGLWIDPDLFKNEKGNYEIPAEAQEEVVNLLLLYTSKEVKAVRKGEFDNLTILEMKAIIDSIKVLLTNTLRGKALLVELERLEGITQYSLRKSIHDIEIEGIKKVVDETNRMLAIDFELTLNQSDRVALMNYYNEELKRLHIKLSRITEIVSETREEEIYQITEKDIELVTMEVDSRLEIDKLVLRDILKTPKNYVKELCKISGIIGEEDLLKELKQLQTAEGGTMNFRLTSDVENYVEKAYHRSIEDLLNEAIILHQEE